MFPTILLQTILVSILVTTETARVIDPVIQNIVDGVVLHEKSAYLSFTVMVPLSTKDLPLMVARKNPDCSSSSATENFYCPLIFYLQTIQNDLRSLITTEQSLQKPESDQPTRKNSCDGIPGFFPSLSITNDLFVETRDTLVECLEQEKILEEFIRDHFQPTWINHYNESMSSYDASYGPTTQPETRASSMIAQSVLNLGGFFHYFAERTRWEDSINRCKVQHLLPPLLIRDEVLEDQLTALEKIEKGMKINICVSFSIF
jgi:hypothetical protein